MKIHAWHFLYDTGLMRDGRKPAKVETFDGELKLCHSGLHASVGLLDALQYAPGAILCRVRCTGTIVKCDDKLVCSQREILWQVNATGTLREFARLCALRAARVYAAYACEKSGLAVHAATLRALADSSTVEQIGDAAGDAARDAAGDAARASARAAARDAQAAAQAAARAAARASARDAGAAVAAARDAAGAAQAAERRWQTALLLRMVRKLRSAR